VSSEEKLILPEEIRKEKKLRRVHEPFYRQLVINLAKALGVVLVGAAIVLLTQYGYVISPVLGKFLSGVSISSMPVSTFALISNTTILKLLLAAQSYTVSFTVTKCTLNGKNCTKGIAIYSRKGLEREFYLICMSHKCTYYEAISINPKECLLSINGTRIRVVPASELSIPFIYYCKITGVVPSPSGFCVTCNVGKLKNVEMCFSNAAILYKIVYKNGTYTFEYTLRSLISSKMYVSPSTAFFLIRKSRT